MEFDFDDAFISATREKHQVENDLFSRICKFVVSIIFIMMLNSFGIPLWEFPQSFLSAYMLYQATLAAFYAIMVVAWQYYEHKLLNIRNPLF